jgi:hypothetical protein
MLGSLKQLLFAAFLLHEYSPMHIQHCTMVYDNTLKSGDRAVMP